MAVNFGTFLKHIVPSSIVLQKLRVEHSLLFTFDDGPDPEITPRVLDILDRYGVHGLFFIPGLRIKRAPHLLKEIIARKHGIGNHSLNHVSNEFLSFQEIVKEIKGGSDRIFDALGIRTTLYRPPMGIITPKLILAAKYCNYKIMRWSLTSGEYYQLRDATSQELADTLLKKVHDRAIIVSHDDNNTIPDFLEMIIPRLIDRGFNLTSGLSSIKWKEEP